MQVKIHRILFINNKIKFINFKHYTLKRYRGTEEYFTSLHIIHFL